MKQCQVSKLWCFPCFLNWNQKQLLTENGKWAQVWDTFNYLGFLPMGKKKINKTFPPPKTMVILIFTLLDLELGLMSGFDASQCTTAGNQNWTEASAAAQWLHHKPVLFLLLPQCLKWKKKPKQTTLKPPPNYSSFPKRHLQFKGQCET